MDTTKTPITLDELINMLIELRDRHPEIKYECTYKTKSGMDDPEKNLEYLDKYNFYTIAGSNAFVINIVDP